ncbi:MAG: outer membrane lipoprotein-sorting protein [Bacteroidota bacterium]|nr:outer membrane lipoprotein-sorting protein [Bacteroidota bacterium]
MRHPMLSVSLPPVLLLLVVLLHAAPVSAQTATEIIDRAERILRGKTSRGTYEMTVVTPEYTRTMKMEYWWDDANDRSLIRTIAPKKEAGNKWLKIGNEMWNYLRATETTIKIPPSMMLQSWNGSDFSNDDLARESSMREDYTHEIIAEEDINGEACWKISSIPRPTAAVVWGKLYTWVRKKDFLPSVAQYYDEKGKLVRYLVYSDFVTMDGRLLPARWSMHNKTKDGHRTEFVIVAIDFDVTIPDRVFSFRELERGN